VGGWLVGWSVSQLMQDNEELELGSWLVSQLILDNEELEVGGWVVSWLVGLTTDAG
jgi:hypothetical protein